MTGWRGSSLIPPRETSSRRMRIRAAMGSRVVGYAWWWVHTLFLAVAYDGIILLHRADFREDLLLSSVLSGLRKPSNSTRFTVQIRGPWFMTLRAVNGLLAKHGYERMVSARRARNTARNWSGNEAVPTRSHVPLLQGPIRRVCAASICRRRQCRFRTDVELRHTKADRRSGLFVGTIPAVS